MDFVAHQRVIWIEFLTVEKPANEFFAMDQYSS